MSGDGPETDPFSATPGFNLESEIRRCDPGLALDDRAVERLAAHARAVLRRNAELKLTSIVEPGAFVERHIGESLQGAAMLPAAVAGRLLDLGSGNGYPGVPVCIAHPGLSPLLAEARQRKALFLGNILTDLSLPGSVLGRRVDRPADLEEGSRFVVIVTRASGDWERSLPRLAGRLEDGGRLLVWAGAEVERIAERDAWKRYVLDERRALSGRDASWVWRFKPAR